MLGCEGCQGQISETLTFEKYTEPMRDLILPHPRREEKRANSFLLQTQESWMVNRQKIQGILQTRPDLVRSEINLFALIGTRLRRKFSHKHSVLYPVRSVLPGVETIPLKITGKFVPSVVLLQFIILELPELFMDFIVSVTGKSPSTTGAGSEGALPKLHSMQSYHS